MTHYQLKPHPDFPALAASGVEVEVRREGDSLMLAYAVRRDERVRWPAPACSARADDLWRASCFELFLMFDDQEHYVEFNFSPSASWAAYAFDGHREGRTPLDIGAPRIERRPDGLAVACDLSGLPRGEHQMGLSAVIEEDGGVFSYWALAHPPGAPDFHHAACFAATLPPPAGT